MSSQRPGRLIAKVVLIFVAAFTWSAYAGSAWAQCASDADCTVSAPFTHCVDMLCSECATDPDCASGEVCNSGHCDEAMDCQTDEDCDSESHCDGQHCASGPAVTCATDDDCLPTETCQGGNCVSGGDGGTSGGTVGDNISPACLRCTSVQSALGGSCSSVEQDCGNPAACQPLTDCLSQACSAECGMVLVEDGGTIIGEAPTMASSGCNALPLGPDAPFFAAALIALVIALVGKSGLTYVRSLLRIRKKNELM